MAGRDRERLGEINQNFGLPCSISLKIEKKKKSELESDDLK